MKPDILTKKPYKRNIGSFYAALGLLTKNTDGYYVCQSQFMQENNYLLFRVFGETKFGKKIPQLLSRTAHRHAHVMNVCSKVYQLLVVLQYIIISYDTYQHTCKYANYALYDYAQKKKIPIINNAMK